MIRFLLKGLLRDRNRSLFPVLIVTVGVATSIVMYCFLHGVIDEAVRSNARLDTGHVTIMTRGYRDMALTGVGRMLAALERHYPDMEWTPRIRFGGLLDIPDESGETRAQGPAFGIAVDLLGEESNEAERLQLGGALVRGRLPAAPGEILVSDEFAANLDIEIGETATLISATSYGSMAVHNFVVAGTLRFGIGPLDRNTVIVDIADARYALNMEDGAGELLGFFPNLVYDAQKADRIASSFNDGVTLPHDEFSPVMVTLREQNGLGEYLDLARFRVSIILFVFFFVMSIVLWNAGLMAGIRRYGEIGVRLAIGESKGHVYRSTLCESFLIGIVGSVTGTAVGLAVSYYLQEVGLDISGMMKESTILIANIIRAKIDPLAYYIGFMPGLLATFLGSAASGIGIFKRQTAQLFKELEA
jgi:putative ABC transport system permease protein